MIDKADKETEMRLREIEERLKEVYAQSEKDITEAWNNYLKGQGEKIDALQKAYDKAKLSGDDDAKELGKQLGRAKTERTLQNQYYKDMVAETTKKLATVNETALRYVNDQMPNIYSINYNDAAIDCDRLGFRFDLVDEGTVKRLVTDGDIKLPNKALNIPKDMRWNTKQLNSSVLQGIVNGESMDKIAKRILPVVNNNAAAAIRNARTMVNGAENLGRLDSLKQMKNLGIVVEKVWMATHDERTRASHAYLDGEGVAPDEAFPNGLMCPGDPDGPPEEVYNCRCKLIREIRGFISPTTGEFKEVNIHNYEPDYFDKEEIGKEIAEKTKESVVQYNGENINPKIFSGLDDETKQYLIKSLENADDDIRALIERTSNNLSVKWNDGEGTSCYWEGRGNIDMCLSKYGERRDNEDIARTFWHEYGHYLDDASISNSGYSVKVKAGDYYYTFDGITAVAKEGAGSVFAGGAYGDAAIKDINAFLDRYNLSSKYYVARTDEYSLPWIKYKESGDSIDFLDMPFEDHRALSRALSEWSRDISGYNKANNYLYDMGYPKAPEYTDYMMPYRTPKRQTLKYKERFKGALQKYQEDSASVDAAQTLWRETHDWDTLIKEQSALYEAAKKKEEKLGPATDTFDGAAFGFFSSVASTGGHSHDYYCRNDNNIKEGVANVFSTITLKDPDMIKAMEDLCPNIYELLKGIIKK